MNSLYSVVIEKIYLIDNGHGEMQTLQSNIIYKNIHEKADLISNLKKIQNHL